MAVYVYKCKSCSEISEHSQNITAPSLTICPSCGGELYRVMQPAAVLYKGSGFYSTDSRPSSWKDYKD